MNEENQKPTNIRIHDVAVLIKRQRTGEDGKKLGYDFYAKDRLGVVIELSETTMTLKYADGSIEEYDQAREDKEYYYQVGVGSEVEYERAIEKHVFKKTQEIKDKQEELAEAMSWLRDFKERVSIWNRVMKAIKNI